MWDPRAAKTRSINILQHGNNEINSRGYYLDLFMPAYSHYLNDPLPYNCPDSLKHSVLGGEAAIWSELVNEENIEARYGQELLQWRRDSGPPPLENVDDMYRGLFVIKGLALQGLQHIEIYERPH